LQALQAPVEHPHLCKAVSERDVAQGIQHSKRLVCWGGAWSAAHAAAVIATCGVAAHLDSGSRAVFVRLDWCACSKLKSCVHADPCAHCRSGPESAR
jgi:hypothetical protein